MQKRLLLLTNADRGQANVFLAAADALLRCQIDVAIHFASFDALESEVRSLWQNDQDAASSAKKSVSFHKIRGLSMAEGLREHFARSQTPCREDYFPESFLAPLSTGNSMRAICDAVSIFVPYDGPQLEQVYSSICDIITTVSPDLVLVDALMTAGLTACYQMDVNFHCLSPNSIKEFAGPSQPRAATLWKFPALFSGYQYPVRAHLIPINIFLILYAVYQFRTSRSIRDVQKWMVTRKNAQLRTPLDLLRDRPPKLRILVGCLPELDFPVLIPQHVTPCGPILRRSRDVKDADADLAAWLTRGPVIYINLGSICRTSEDQACELARAIVTVLRTTPSATSYRVVWKLKKQGSYQVEEKGSRLFNILAQDFKSDLVRIYDWLQPEPTALLQSGNIACSVHHGGANSYFESASSGVPQVVLPQWTDCYDYAQRVEHLGIGRIGSRLSCPLWDATELAGELLHVLVGPQADHIKGRAMEMSHICRRNGNGALKVVDFIAEELALDATKVSTMHDA